MTSTSTSANTEYLVLSGEESIERWDWVSSYLKRLMQGEDIKLDEKAIIFLKAQEKFYQGKIKKMGGIISLLNEKLKKFK